MFRIEGSQFTAVWIPRIWDCPRFCIHFPPSTISPPPTPHPCVCISPESHSTGCASSVEGDPLHLLKQLPPLLTFSFPLSPRRFSVQRCARCHLGISASEMVMRARELVYHLNCFTCSTCAKMLTTGDHFGMKDSLVYCRLHFEALLQGEYQLHFNHAEGAAGKGPALGASAALGLPYYNGVGTVQKGRPRKRKSPGPGADLAAYNAGKTPAGGEPGRGGRWTDGSVCRAVAAC